MTYLILDLKHGFSNAQVRIVDERPSFMKNVYFTSKFSDVEQIRFLNKRLGVNWLSFPELFKATKWLDLADMFYQAAEADDIELGKELVKAGVLNFPYCIGEDEKEDLLESYVKSKSFEQLIKMDR